MKNPLSINKSGGHGAFPLTLIIIFLLAASCTEDNNTIDKKIELKNNLLITKFTSNNLDISQTFKSTIFSFEANKLGDIIHSNFTISTLDQKIVYETQYTIDNTEKHYKLNQTDKVLAIANNINYKFKKEIYEYIERHMHVFFNNVLREFHDKNISSILDMLYFHNSIISIKKRSKNSNKENCECTLHPGYLIDKTGFLCQEDFFIPIQIINDLIKDISNDTMLSKTEKNTFKEYMSTLVSSKKKKIAFDEFYSFFVNKKRFNASIKAMKKGNKNILMHSQGDCILGLGSGHGCCGNYSGCCYYWNPVCYVHDKICYNV